MSDQVQVSIWLEPAQALALAQFDLMMDAMNEVAKALAEAGYAPR